NTPTKKTVEAGTHNVVMWRDGYESWNKTMDVKSGTVVWLNYALMVPNKLTVEPVASYASVAASVASPK
ncbi:PEGA domain-containing protein, partial [Escherichia coli]|uniref:PEGA domain-containing protein n=1 Tax=Escherichia coli TaxID=562 RepID=UPI001411E1AD